MKIAVGDSSDLEKSSNTTIITPLILLNDTTDKINVTTALPFSTKFPTSINHSFYFNL